MPTDLLPTDLLPDVGPASPAVDTEHKWRRVFTVAALLVILVFAFVLRAWNLDWDRGSHLQPDERFWSDVAANVENPSDWRWSEVLDPEKSTLNPRVYKPNYVYGTLPLWASEAAAGVLMTDNMNWAVRSADAVGINLLNDAPINPPILLDENGEEVEPPLSDRFRFNTGFDVTIIGRLMSALVDTMTVAMVFLLARELTDSSRVGLLAALLQACTVLHIQYSHFLGSEPWVAFFVTCAVWGSVRLARHRGGWPTRIFTAVAVGLSIASKLSGIASVAAPAMAALVVLGPDLGKLFAARIEPGVIGRMARRIEPYLVMLLLAIVAYRIAQPYDFQAGVSLIFNQRFEADIEYLSDINSGGNWPWVQPLVGRTPLIHPLKQMFLWGMGPGLGLAAIFGMGRAARRFFLGERYWAVPLAVIGAYFVLVSLQFYAIIRYLQPAYPVITALSAAGLVAAWRWAHQLGPERSGDVQRRVATAVKAGVVIAIGATLFWALAFVNGVYANTNARLAAGDWMVENLPAGAAVSQQAWDDGLPWGQASDFEKITLEPFSFGGDSPERIELLIQGLDQVDYVIESSNKFYDSLPRTPARFPQMTQYYDALFDGSLGFELVKTFQNNPSLLGITIDDSNAEEAFTLYDHPTVFIWRKTDSFSVERAYALLNPDRARTAVNALPKDAFANASMLSPAEYETQQGGSSFRDVHSFDPSSPVAAVLWFALIQMLSLAIAPTLVQAAGRAGGAVYGLAKPLAMVVLALPVWLLVSTGVVTMSRPLVLFAFLAIVAGGAWRSNGARDRVRELWQTHRRTIIAAEVVFCGIFLLVLWLRVSNPDTWHPWRGGEKPMELAYLTAVTGSTTMPPYDPWLAGGSLNYYYMGWFVLAVPIRILGLAPDVGFNLGVATYAALAAVTVYSTAAMLSELARRRNTRLMRPAETGAIAVVFFLIMGNLDGFRQLLAPLEPEGGYGRLGGARFALAFVVAVAGGVGIYRRARRNTKSVTAALASGAAAIGLFLVINIDRFALLLTETQWGAFRIPWSDFDWWDPSRVNKFVPGETCGAEGLAPCGFEVTEFPSFTVLFADLHPHFMAMSFFGLGLAGCIAFIERARMGRLSSTWILAIGLGVGSGFIRMVHTWDMPTFVLFVVGAIVIGWVGARGPAAWRAKYAIGQLVAAGAAHMAVTAPYRARNQVAESGFKRTESVTNLDDWIAHWGLFLFVAVAYVGSRLWARREQIIASAWLTAGGAMAMVLIAIIRFTSTGFDLEAAGALALVGLVATAILLIVELGDEHRSTPHVFVAACWLLGFSVMVGVESFTQKADVARLNTVFKFWLQVWHLFAVAGAFAVSWLLGTLWQTMRAQVGTPAADRAVPVRAKLFAGGLVMLLLASLVYPVLAVTPRQDNRIDTALGPSLDGQLWLTPGQYRFGIRDVNGVDHEIDPGQDRAILDWLQANVDGRPTIVEAVGGSEYQWWGRISINSGLPTVLGWRWHQSQQRTLFDTKVNERKADIAEFYTTDSRERIDSFLRAYDVSYVIVGSIESTVANPRTLDLFAEHPSLTAVFTEGPRAIYQVDKISLANELLRPLGS